MEVEQQKEFCIQPQIKLFVSKIGLGLEVLVAELLAGEGELPDVLQAVGGRLLHVLVLRPNQLEQVGDNLVIQILKLKGFLHNIFHRSNFISWIVMGCGIIAHCGRG